MIVPLSARIALPLLLLVTQLALAAPAPAFAPSADAEAALAGRLGGQLDSFVARFGEPIAAIAGSGQIFYAEGYGFFGVQFNRGRSTEGQPDRARVITISAPRPLDLPALTPDPGDWSRATAEERVRALLPTDVALGDFSEVDETGQITASCASDALQAAFGVVTLGQCRLSLIAPTPTTVSYATLTLTAGAGQPGEQEAEPDPCDGAVDWIRRAGDRLDRARQLLDELATLDAADPDASTLLRDNAIAFAGLATDQRGDSAPGALADAAYYLVSAFTTYSAAFENAAAGVEAADQHLVDEAIAQIEQAGTRIGQATTALADAGDACGLELGTPVARAGIPVV